MRKVHFTLGEGAGQLIVNIAREHLMYSLNPDKALKAIKDSLVGCPTEIALDILIGKLILITNEDKVSLNAIQYTPDMKDEFPPYGKEVLLFNNRNKTIGCQIFNDGYNIKTYCDWYCISYWMLANFPE